MYHVYLILCGDDSIYTGIAKDVEKRFNEHKSGKGSRYTRARKVLKILYFEQHQTRSQATKREVEIKSWSREKKLKLTDSK